MPVEGVVGKLGGLLSEILIANPRVADCGGDDSRAVLFALEIVSEGADAVNVRYYLNFGVIQKDWWWCGWCW